MCKNTLLGFLIPFFFLTDPHNVLSQSFRPEDLSGFHLERYTDESGLPQNSVYSIAEDELGYIWLATERGLARFDGKNFKVFENFGKTYNAASIGSFHMDPRPNPAGFFAMNRDQCFIHIYQGKAVVDSTMYRQLNARTFPYVEKGRGYISERLPTLFYGTPFHDPFYIPTGIDRFFVYSAENLAFYDGKKKLGQVNRAGKTIWNFFRLDTNLYHLENKQLTRFAADSRTFKAERANFEGELINDPSYREGKHMKVFWNNATNQVCIVIGKSLYHITLTANGNLTSTLILCGFDFEKEQIKAVYYEVKKKRIFIGSQLNGLWVLTRKQFTPLATNFPGTDQVYYGQGRMGTNSILSSQGIVYAMDEQTGNVNARQLPLITAKVFWDKSSILIDHEGFIWCKLRGRLMMMEPDGSKMKFSWTLPSEITQLYQGIDKTIWVLTRTQGLFLLKAPFTADNKPTLFLKGPLTDISCIAEQGTDTIWVGTGRGLFSMSRKTRAVTSVKGLEDKYIRSLCLSRDSPTIWISTYKDGFFLLRNKKLTHFPLDTLGYLANAHCIVEDNKGFLWITTNRGLFQILKADLLKYADRPGELYYHHYSKTDGFNSNEFNGGCQPCAVRLSSGFVSLPSMDGLIWFKPETTVAEVPDKKIMIDQIEIDRKIIAARQKHILFSQDQKQLRLTVSSPFFGNPENMEFSYTLVEEGKAPMNSDWLSLETNSNIATITISTLSKGKYTLHIRKKNGFGMGNYGYRTVGITVHPFWYQTWWFYMLVVLALILCFFIYSKYRIRAVQRRSVLLELQVSERTNQLQATLRNLEKSQDELLNQMHLQSRLMASIAHDVRSPLGAAIIVAEEIQKMLDQQQYDMVSLFTKNIAEAIRQVKGSLEDSLAYVKIHVYKREPNTERIALHDLIEENMQLYGKNSKIKTNVFLNLIPRDASVVTNAQLLKIIIHNLVDNANKFTDGGQIKAYTAQNGNRLNLAIEDSGRGIPPEIIEWFSTGIALPVASSPGGIGLAMVKELAPAVAESILIERLSPGTRVTMTFYH
ncbi:Signal transduction histidine kinase [Dyadobacter soli]|uniref:histidine kinase n=1 Tax=Dyadobacter soli TaxID=659014 RepID=A0A1G8BV57_9BACT|nr:Signal transduction histidine kinase [Dyadobacter soli]